MKIMHIYANRINFGDWASSEGVKKMLRDNFEGEIFFKDRFYLDEYTNDDINYINSEIDIVVVGGGGLFWQKDTSVGWLWNIDKKLLLAIEKPVYFFAVGLNANQLNNKGKLKKETENNIKIIFQKKENFFLGVRDRLTYDWAKKLSIKNLFFTVCPSLFLFRNKIQRESHNIGINIVPREYMINPKYIENSLFEAIKVLEAKGLKTIIIPHNSTGPSEYEVKLAKLFDINIQYVYNLNQLYEVYNNLSFSLVMRAHPILFSFSQRTPVLPILYNIKSKAFLELFNYPFYIKMPSVTFYKKKYMKEKIIKFYKHIEPNKYISMRYDDLIADYKKQCVAFADMAINYS